MLPHGSRLSTPGPDNFRRMRHTAAYATEPHLVDHLAPILHALGADVTLTVPQHLEQHARALGLTPTVSGDVPRCERVIVAGYYDLEHATHFRGIPSAVLVEHGAGQQYQGVTHGGYTGGNGRDAVELFVVPNDTVATENRRRYPNADVAVVGCPKLDQYHRRPPSNPDPIVAVAFHWRCRIAPEAGTAFDSFAPWLGALHRRAAAAGIRVVGHAHPRLEPEARALYRETGIDWVTADEILRSADVLVMDNTSLGYEAAALRIPVVAMNDPAWRRDVHHGLRFWDTAPGPTVDRPDQLPHAITFALEHGPSAWAWGRVVDRVYSGLVDGRAAERAATAIRGQARS